MRSHTLEREELVDLARHAGIRNLDSLTAEELAEAIAEANADLPAPSRSTVEPITGVVESEN